MRARHAVIGTTLGAILLAGCTSARPAGPDDIRTRASTTTSTAASVTPTATVRPAPTATPDPASLAALLATRFDGHGLRLGREGGSTSAYRQYFATYEGGGLTISGRINIPRGRGPFPAVVLAHGYVDPARYTNGATMLRERDYLARQGYVTLHIDYRNHAQSSRDPDNDAALRVGYTEDAINAGLALKGFSLVDPGRIALVGPDASRSAVARAVIARLGTPESQPQRWALTSPRTFFDRVSDPLLIHHGTADESCPIAWSRATVAALRAKGKNVRLFVYEGQRHTFTTQWPLSIRRTAAFLAEHLR